MRELGFMDDLQALGFTGAQCAAAIGNVIGRMAAPGSELATWGWLKNESALGELLDVDFAAMPLMRLYRASDLCCVTRRRSRRAVRAHPWPVCSGGDRHAVRLDQHLFRGPGQGQPKAARGHSKEKRSECPLLTLGLVLDGAASSALAGVRRQRGGGAHASKMLKDLQAPEGALVVMDRGIATEENVAWLKAHGYRYIVVARDGRRQFDPHQAIEISAAGGQKIGLHKELSEEARKCVCIAIRRGASRRKRPSTRAWQALRARA